MLPLRQRKRLLRDRKGFSLMEAVVAMSVILVVAGAAITLIISSVRADATFRNQYRAMTACDNARACIRFADGDGDVLAEALIKAGFTGINENHYLLISGEYEVEVTFEDENYVVAYNDETIYRYQAEQ